MKKTLYILLALIVAVLFFVLTNRHDENAATKQDLEQVRAELLLKIDSVLRKTDTIKTDIDTLKTELRAVRANTDTIKAGQAVIFRTMKENEGKTISLWDIIFK